MTHPEINLRGGFLFKLLFGTLINTDPCTVRLKPYKGRWKR